MVPETGRQISMGRLVLLRSMIVVAAVSSWLPSDLQAQYLDPGAGSVMVQAIIAGLVGGATVLKLYWSKIRGLLARAPRRPNQA